MRCKLLLSIALTLAACTFDAALPADSLLACRSPSDCPEPLICLVSEERCVPPGSACVTIQDGIAVAGQDGNTCGEGSICIRGACKAERCGDGFVSGAETCDGTLGCRDNCTRCGDGITDPGEDCDNGPANGALTSGACPATCVADCGNGFVDFGEICDDGNENPADGCDACTQTTWGSRALVGGGVNALELQLGGAFQIAVDPSGTMYIAHQHRVRRVDPAGNVTTVAGTGDSGFSGDGDSALSATLRELRGVAVSGLGKVYIADDGNHRVRRVQARLPSLDSQTPGRLWWRPTSPWSPAAPQAPLSA